MVEGAVTLEMEIRPRYLVPDTNCFIEHLSVIIRALDSKKYSIMVPLTGMYLGIVVEIYSGSLIRFLDKII